MKKILLSALMTTSLFATTYTLNPGWNLLGTISEIPVSQILANSEVRNVVIYQNGSYESSAANEFTTIPVQSGFFVYTDSQTTIDISDGNPPSSTLQHLDGDLNPTTDATWDILKVVDANLLIEMKTSTYNAGLTYDRTDARSYCLNLVVGSTSGWRLPTISELHSLSDIYVQGNENHFIIRSADSVYWSITPYDTDDGYLWSFDGEPYTGYSEATDKFTDYYYGICVKDSQ